MKLKIWAALVALAALSLATWLLGPVVPVVAIIAGCFCYVLDYMARRPRPAGMLALAIAFALVLIGPAHAEISIGAAFGAWQPYIDAAVSALILGLVGIVLELIRRKVGISIEDSQRAALQTALTNAAGLALNKLGNSLQGKTISTNNEAIDEAVNYVLRSAPDAVAKFGITPASLREKILAKLPQVANTTAPPA